MTDTAQQFESDMVVWIDGVQVSDQRFLECEIEEHTLGASTCRLVLEMAPLTPEGEEETEQESATRRRWPVLEDERFELLRRLSVKFTLAPQDGNVEHEAVVFDGYVTAVAPTFGAKRDNESRLELSGFDAFYLLHFEDRHASYDGHPDSKIVDDLFREYGFGRDVEGTSPARHLNDGSIVQRTTDAELIRWLARRNGYEAYVERSDTDIQEGQQPGTALVGHFHKPRLDRNLQPALTLFPDDYPSIVDMTARWDSHKATSVQARTLDTRTRRIQRVEVLAPRLKQQGTITRKTILEERLPQLIQKGGHRTDHAVGFQFRDQPHDSTELDTMAWAHFVEENWLATATATVNGKRYPGILRARRPVPVEGGGELVDGEWYVRRAKHVFDNTVSPNTYEVEVELVRNGLGEAPSGT